MLMSHYIHFYLKTTKVKIAIGLSKKFVNWQLHDDKFKWKSLNLFYVYLDAYQNTAKIHWNLWE